MAYKLYKHLFHTFLKTHLYILFGLILMKGYIYLIENKINGKKPCSRIYTSFGFPTLSHGNWKRSVDRKSRIFSISH